MDEFKEVKECALGKVIVQCTKCGISIPLRESYDSLEGLVCIDCFEDSEINPT